MNWSTRRPRVYRYMERKYVDEYFATGRLMLSSFQRFAKHPDEPRQDSKEGKTFLLHRTEQNGGQSLVVEVDYGHNAYVLCGSMLPSIELMESFGADSGIVIKDTAAFAASVANAIEGFVRGYDGPCSYQLRRIIEHDLGWLELGPTEQTDDLSKFDQRVLEEALKKYEGPDPYFLKNSAYVAQAEWRFIWLVDIAVTESLVIEIPESRAFCERWEGQGDVIAFGDGRV